MNPELLRQRIMRIVTRPPELLYALSRHWLLILLCLAVATVARWAFVVNELPVFEGRAQLVITPADESSPGTTPAISNLRIDQIKTFLQKEASTIGGDTLLRNVVAPLIADQPRDDEARRRSRDRTVVGSVRGKVNRLKESLAKWAGFQEPEEDLSGEQVDIYKAVRNFKLTSRVVPDTDTHSVHLFVYGAEPDRVRDLLERWISAYEKMAVEKTRRSLNALVEGQKKTFRLREEKARRQLTVFREKNPNINGRLSYVDSQIGNQTAILTALSQSNRSMATNHVELEALRAQLVQKRVVANLPEDNPVVVRIEVEIAKMEREMSQPELNGEAETIEESLRRKRQAVLTTLGDLHALKSHLTDLKGDQDRLASAYQSTLLRLEEYTLSSDLRPGEAILITRANEPTVAWEPFEYYPVRKVLIGSCVGLMIGVFLAVILELLCGKVRFKHDIIEDFGLPVVAVFPK